MTITDQIDELLTFVGDLILSDLLLESLSIMGANQLADILFQFKKHNGSWALGLVIVMTLSFFAFLKMFKHTTIKKEIK